MALLFRVSVAATNAMCDALVDLVDAGGAGTLNIRTGAQPAATTDADSGTDLAVLTFNATAFGAASAGVATANAITADSSANGTGDAGHFRVRSGAGTVIFQGNAGNAADTTDMTIDNKSIATGQQVSCTSFTVTVPTT